MARRIQLRRDTAANWTSTNPVLAQGEIGLDLTSMKIKIGIGGDPASRWNNLPYWDDEETAAIGAFEFAGNVITTNDSSNVIIDQAVEIKSDLKVAGDLEPTINLNSSLGSPTKQWKDIFVSNGSVYIGDIKLSNNNGTLLVQQVTDAGLVTEEPIEGSTGVVTTDRLIVGEVELVLSGGADPYVTFPAITGGNQLAIQGSEIATLSGTLGLTSLTDIRLNANGNNAGGIGAQVWNFGADGKLTLPGGATVKDLPGETLEESILILGAGSTIAENQRSARIGLNGAISGVSIGAGDKDWTFLDDGVLTLPAGGDIVDSNGDSVLGGGTISVGNGVGPSVQQVSEILFNGSITEIGPNVVAVSVDPSLTDDHEIKITVGNTEYFAIVNRANNNDDGVKSSGVAYDSEGNMITLHVSEVDISATNDNSELIDRLIISKFNDVGVLQWQTQIVEDIDTENDHDLLIDADDNIIVAVSKDNPGPDNIILVKISAQGEVLWQEEYSGTVLVDITDTVTLTSNIVGETTFEGNTVDVVTVQYDYSSPFNWQLQETTDDITWTTIGTSVGNSYDSNADTTQYYFADGSITALLDEDAKNYRLYREAANSSLEVTAIALSGTDIVVAAEYIENTDNSSNQGFLMKVNSTGTVQWARIFSAEASTTPYGMDVGADGDIVVVGVAEPVGAPAAAFAQKFDGDTGAAGWIKILFGPNAGNNYEYAGGDVVIDSQNNIFVTVNSNQPIVHNDSDSLNVTVSHVMKLNTAGETQWCRRIGPGPCASVATGIDCDDSGNVYLAALTVAQENPVRDVSEFFSSKNVLAVAKYSTAGAVLWQRYIESDYYYFYSDADTDGAPGEFDGTKSRGRNMSIGPDGKLAIQVSAFNRDPDDYTENSPRKESITFQIDQDGREMTVGSGNERFTVKASRIPGRFVTIEDLISEEGDSRDFSEDLSVSSAALTFGDAELAQQIARSAPYEYVFGNDGTLTIPNDGDVKLTQTQIGWFSIFGPANNDINNVWIRANCVDLNSGDVYVVGQENDNNRGFVARYDSQGQIQWSIRLYDDVNGSGTRCNAVKIHPTNGNVVVLCEYFSNETGVLIVQIDPDTARIESEVGFRDLGEDSGVNAYDFAFLDIGDSSEAVVVVGRKYDEWKATPVTPLSGSGVGVIIAANASLPTELDTGWQVSGTGITGRTNIQYFNLFTNLTSTVREGSGAQFQVVSTGSGDPYASALATVPNKGSNYLVGHKILIAGTDLGGATPANDAIIEVTEVGEGGSIEAVTVSGTAGDTVGIGGTYNGLTGTNYQTGTGFAFSEFFAPYETGQDYSNTAGYVHSGGTNYVVGDVITVPGTQLGGTSPANDMTLTVVSAPGGIVSDNWTYAGTPQLTNRKISVNSVVDFSGEGSWNLDQPLGGEAFVAVSGTGEFDLAWTKVLSAGDESDTERYLSVAVDASNNIYAVGEMIARNNAAGGDLNSYWCAVVSKFNSSGTHQWTKALNDNINACYAKGVAVQGNTVVVTHENSNNGTTVVTKLDATGAIKWQRKTYTGDDSSVAIDTNGDVYVVAEAYMESDYGNCVKVIKFNSTGEIIWRKILATQLIGNNNTSEYFKNGRNLTLDSDNLYISGYTTAYDNNYENGFLAKIPKSGDQDGVYSVWVIQNDTYDVDKVNATEATAFTPVIGNGEWELWEPDFASQWWDPSDNDYYHTLTEMRDRDGGAIEFADGTRQTSSAQQIPQVRINNGADHRLTMDDMGKHIYVTNENTRIAVPYHETDPLPMGYTVVIINNSGNPISIDADGGGIDIIVPGVDTSQYWDLPSPGMATLIKVDESTWFMTGNVTVD